MVIQKKKKTRKRKGYQRGIYSSPIAGICKFRSSWEKKYMEHLDADPQVSSWSYEKLVIEYVSNRATGKIRKYYPDFFIEMKSGSRVVVEIKQKRKLQTAPVKKKTAAALKWCAENKAEFLLITEVELKELGLL
jgi:hypothetical protein